MRVKGGPKSKNRRKRVLKQAEGFTGRSRNSLRLAMEAVDRAMQYNYRDRKNFKRKIRGLWIVRLTAAVRAEGFSYSRFIAALKTKNISLNRKMLSDLAATEPQAFRQIVQASGVTSSKTAKAA